MSMKRPSKHSGWLQIEYFFLKVPALLVVSNASSFITIKRKRAMSISSVSTVSADSLCSCGHNDEKIGLLLYTRPILKGVKAWPCNYLSSVNRTTMTCKRKSAILVNIGGDPGGTRSWYLRLINNRQWDPKGLSILHVMYNILDINH